ncbi:cyclin-dependent protein kinase inhibitor [Phellopilus nigrolimitatus]|nr:cyclin-dependent protein kinase inhibitor [Phellopilus nigrolimitatus]
MEFFNDVGGDPSRPSLFELVAQEQLRDLLQPALKYVLSVFAQRYPRYLLRVVNRHEEFYALVMLIVERHYLRTHAASFAENFYGLKRRRRPLYETERAKAAVGSSSGEGKLREQDLRHSLFFLVAVPYLRAKAQDYFEALGGGVDPSLFDENTIRSTLDAEDSLISRLRAAYRKIYPWLNMSFEVWLMCYNLAYLFDRTAFYRPWLSWIGVDLRRLGPEDTASGLPAHSNDVSDPVIHTARPKLILRSPRLLLESLKILLPTAIFFVKFLEWWYSPSSPARTVSAPPTGPPIPPPKLLKPHPQGVPFDNTKYGECPLCTGPIANATALPSGYVFCYRCVYKHVEENGKCPVTLTPAYVWQLRKILALVQIFTPHFVRAKLAKTRAQFGKQILAQQVPGWSPYYLDYKGLKKIVSSLTSGRPGTEAAALALGARPGADWHTAAAAAGATAQELPPGSPLIADLSIALLSASGKDEDRGPNFQAHKTAFFFKLERELEKINSFYLQKEAELKLRLETLLSKRMTAATRLLPNTEDSTPKDHVEWKAVEEGFRLLERDLAKLQILKKWDKRSKSTTKEMYLSRQVEVQPVFNRQLIGELSDIVAQCLLDLTDLTVGLSGEGSVVNDMILTHQIALERSSRMGPYHDLETNLQNAVKAKDERAIRELIRQSDTLHVQPGGKTHVTRILWKVIIDAPAPLADLILSCPSVPFDFQFIDDINGRTCLHEAAMTGELRLVNLCIAKEVQTDRADVYGRTALHYAAMNGHTAVCRRLIVVGLHPSSLDMDNYTPLMYAVLKGNTECVQILLDEGQADVGPPSAAHDLIPLSLACRVGHIEVVKLLLQHNAKSIPNTNGEYPVHIAAQEGQADICRMLINYEGWDTPDKNGHESCVRVLLELGSRAAFYAAWYGHPECPPPGRLPLDLELVPLLSVSPTAVLDNSAEIDLDMIPSLSLPPPIMPYRAYGHNFLDKTCLVHVSIGHPFSHVSKKDAAVHLSPRMMGGPTAQYPHASPLFKLVMTSRPDITSAPYSVSVPVRDERDCFTFQTASLDNMSLEFSIYPNFGTKTIGRAIALSSMLQGSTEVTFVLPILDHHLHVIGEVLFEVRIITPFKGVTLEIGGAVETYWKSLATPYTSSPLQQPSRMAQPFRTLGSAYTSPSNHSISGTNGHTITLSSLVGDYVHLTVQVTRDLHPVIFNNWKLPIAEFDLGVSDVTFAQLMAISTRAGYHADLARFKTATPSEWHHVLSGALFSLKDLMKVLPPSLGLYLDLAFSSSALRKRETLEHGHMLDLNSFVDSVLKAVYHSSPLQPRRRIVFGSFSPDICAALNWKQPNYPVFLASECGMRSSCPPSPTALRPEDVDDRRLSSISAAVDWAKTNNLLGVFLDADLLTKVPALIQGVKDMGLLLGVYGQREQTELLSRSTNPDTILVDAFLKEGVIAFLDHSPRGFS